MAKVLDGIDEGLAAWIAAQPMFFVGTAPLDAGGHVNVSPKGPIGTLRVLGPHRVAYLDLSGSGAETVAHVQENGRIVVMLCAFQGRPRIVRLHGTGEVVFAADERFPGLVAEARFDQPTVAEAQRSVVDIHVTRVSDSCGYTVPRMTLAGERQQFDLSKRKRLAKMGTEEMVRFQAARNAASIDGLPAVPGGPLPDVRRRARRSVGGPRSG